MSVQLERNGKIKFGKTHIGSDRTMCGADRFGRSGKTKLGKTHIGGDKAM